MIEPDQDQDELVSHCDRMEEEEDPLSIAGKPRHAPTNSSSSAASASVSISRSPSRLRDLQRRTSSSRRLLNASNHEPRRLVVRHPSRRCRQLVQRANSAPNVFDPRDDNSNRRRRTKAHSKSRSPTRARVQTATDDTKTDNDHSRHNARRPTRNSLSRWEHQEGVQRRSSMDNAIAPHRQSNSNSNTTRFDSSASHQKDRPPTMRTRSERLVRKKQNTVMARSRSYTRNRSRGTASRGVTTIRTTSGDFLPQKPPRRTLSPPSRNSSDAAATATGTDEQNKKRDVLKTLPRRSTDGDSIEDNKSQASKDSAPKHPRRPSACETCQDQDIKPPSSTNQNCNIGEPCECHDDDTSSSVHINPSLLGYMDDHETTAEREDELLTQKFRYSRRMSHRSSLGSTKSIRSTKSFGCTGGLPERFKNRRASLGVSRMPPDRSKSFFETASTAENRAEDFGVKRRRHRSMDVTLGFVTGTAKNTATQKRYSRKFQRQMHSFSGVVLGSTVRSFRLQRAYTDEQDKQRRARLGYRRCRSMDLNPSAARRAPSPERKDQRQRSLLLDTNNGDVTAAAATNNHPDSGSDDGADSRSCDVSTVMDALSRNEAEDMTLFTNSSNSSDALTNSVRRGSIGTISLGSGIGSSGFGARQRTSLVQSPKRSPRRSPSKSLSRPPITIADLVENMDNDEGEYIIFIGDKKDSASAKGYNNPSSEDEADDNSTYVSIGGASGASIGWADAAACSSCRGSFASSNYNNSNPSLGTNSVPSLGYRDPDSEENLKRTATCGLCHLNDVDGENTRSKEQNLTDSGRKKTVDVEESDSDEAISVYSEEEWSSEDEKEDHGDPDEYAKEADKSFRENAMMPLKSLCLEDAAEAAGT